MNDHNTNIGTTNNVSSWVVTVVLWDGTPTQIRYRPGAPLVLKGITCTFEGGQRVGVVGRTGSGKVCLTCEDKSFLSSILLLVKIDALLMTEISNVSDTTRNWGCQQRLESNIYPLNNV
jgi:hypothetical protein